MSYLSTGTAATDSYQFHADSTTSDSSYVVSWWGLANSVFDGYEYEDKPDEHREYSVDTEDWPFRIQWGNEHKYWLRVTANDRGTACSSTNRAFYLYYTWNGNYPANYPNHDNVNDLTVNFGPISEEAEVAPETFMKWLEKIGHDEAFLRQSYKMQKKMMKQTGQLPPWDPRKIEQMEKDRERFADRLQRLTEEERRPIEEKLMERWGITEIPPITPELLDQIEESSTRFLRECLSPEEQKLYDEEGHLKVKSRKHSNIIYVIEKKPNGMIKRHINGEYVDKICYQSKWSGLPLNDILAMKVLDLKYNEDEVLKVGNILH